tara:strand:+ start:106 stop:339 length:234 start_codon:yes stop_codon:yes gene_type:complete
MKKLDKNQYEIINDHYIIYISKEQNPNTKLYLYFVDVFEHNNKNAYDNEIFDDLCLSIEYIENNFNIPKIITSKIKL